MHIKKTPVAAFVFLLGSFSVLFLSSYNNRASVTRLAPLTDTSPAPPVIYEKVDIEATFPGGEAAWRQFLSGNLDASVPVRKGAPAGNYNVYVQFVVNKTGHVSDITALTKHGYGMEQEVIRILKLSPDWIPAEQNGRKVNAYRKQPVTFAVIEEKKKRRKRD